MASGTTCVLIANGGELEIERRRLAVHTPVPVLKASTRAWTDVRGSSPFGALM